MDILADVNVHKEIVVWLRQEGHDVVWALESQHNSTDPELLRLSNQEQRVLLTADKDFGKLSVKRRMAAYAVVLLQIRYKSANDLVSTFAKRWQESEPKLIGSFTVITNRKVRSRKLHA